MYRLFEELESWRLNGLVIGFTAGTFDLLHAGHIIMLQEAKSSCDKLIVGLLTDPTISRPDTKNKPVQTVLERYIQLQAIESIDMIIPFDTEQDLYNMLLALSPDKRYVGEEYKGKPHTGHDLKWIEIVYNRRNHNYSSSSLRSRVADSTKGFGV
jgi:glycerol-3-phosphate cytidylyltransferase